DAPAGQAEDEAQATRGEEAAQAPAAQAAGAARTAAGQRAMTKRRRAASARRRPSRLLAIVGAHSWSLYPLTRFWAYSTCWRATALATTRLRFPAAGEVRHGTVV